MHILLLLMQRATLGMKPATQQILSKQLCQRAVLNAATQSQQEHERSSTAREFTMLPEAFELGQCLADKLQPLRAGLTDT